MTTGHCIICGGTYRASPIPGLLECAQCAFVTADVRVSDEQLCALYTHKYFAGEEYKDYLSERPLIERQFRSRLRQLLQVVPASSTKRLFEIGCAYGFFLVIAKEHFASVEGIDISQDAIAHATTTLQLSAHAGDFADHVFTSPPDVVCLWDTIEHVKDPDLYLANCTRAMRPGGIVAITTGDIGSLLARFRGRRWRQIHPPTHLHYFSKATLTRLLAKHGFTVRFSGYDGVYRSADTIAYIILNIKHHYPKVYAALKRGGLLNWNIYLNLYDIVYVIAEKTPTR